MGVQWKSRTETYRQGGEGWSGKLLWEPRRGSYDLKVVPSLSPEVRQSSLGPTERWSGRCCSSERPAGAPQPDADCATACAKNHRRPLSSPTRGLSALLELPPLRRISNHLSWERRHCLCTTVSRQRFCHVMDVQEKRSLVDFVKELRGSIWPGSQVSGCEECENELNCLMLGDLKYDSVN